MEPPRFVGNFGLADAVTAANAALGFAAVAAAAVDPYLAARVVLLAAVADGLDGVIAQVRGGTPLGEFLDSLADVVSFCVAPAAVVFALAADGQSHPVGLAVAVGVPALFVVAGVVRLALYTAFDVGEDSTEGVQTTLAATILAAGVLAGLPPVAVLGATAVFVYLMVSRVEYPDLLPRDAVLMGVVQMAAILLPALVDAVFPKALLAAALGYLLLAPWFYWG